MAQKTRAQITAEIAANLPDNSSGDITPTLVRQTLADISESAPNILDNQPTTIAAGGTGAATAAAALDSLITAEASVASATTTNLVAATTQNVSITGTTTITSFGTANAGVRRFGRFAGILTLTNNATSLILPNAGSNITTAAGDRFAAVSLGSGNWLVYFYQRADGTALAGGAGAVSSVNGQTGVVSLGFGDVGAAKAFASLASSETVYVGKAGNDTTGTGKIDQPYATIQKAIDVIVALGDAAKTKPYLIEVGAGVFTGDIALVPWVWIKGQTLSSVGLNNPSGNYYPGGPTSIAGNITFASSFISGGFVHCGISNLVLVSGNYVDLYLNSGSAGSITHVTNVFVTDQTFSWRGRGADDWIIADGLRVAVQAHAAAGSFYITNSKFHLAISLGGQNCIGYFIGNTCSSNDNSGFPLSFHGSLTTAADAKFYLSGNLISGYWAVDAGAYCTIYTDPSSLPVAAKRTDSVNQVLVLLNDAYSLGYTPTTPGDWSSVPDTVQEALDELAASGGGGGLGGSTGGTDNALLRANGTGGSTVQASGVVVDDSNNMSGVVNLSTTGIVTQVGASIKTANAMGAFAIDVTKSWNTKTIAANQTFTFSGTPATANTFFSVIITNSDSVAHTLTIPSSFSSLQAANITSVIIPASGKIVLTWQYDGTAYNIYGDPSPTTGTGAQVLATSPALVTPSLGTPAAGNLGACTVDGTNLLGYRGAPQLLKTADYTFVLGDSGFSLFHPSSDNNARAFTIPANGSVAFPIGTIIEFINMAAASCTIPITTDTLTLLPAGTTGTRTLAQYGRASVEKVSSTGWIISGNSALT